MAKPVEIDSRSALRDAPEKPIGVSVPMPISRRLDQLVEVAESTGLRVFRKDLVAALILAASEDPEDLSKLVLACRTAKAGDARVSGDNQGAILELAQPKPGRRPRQH
jgi:hypothetical protein